MEELRDALRRYFAYDRFKPGQEEALARVVSRTSKLVALPTGGDKSLVYQLGVMLVDGITVVIDSLTASMKDQVNALSGRGMSACCINTSLDGDEPRARINEARAGRFKIAFVSPERLRARDFSSLPESTPIGSVVLDGAHCISTWGHDFRPDYRRIIQFIKDIDLRAFVALTATAALRVRTKLYKLFDDGCLTVTSDYRIEVSRAIREESHNGRVYYDLHGKSLAVLPPQGLDRPSADFLSWHNEHIFKAG